ncbi:MAG: hypothetical protein ACP5PT_05730 [Brevinematia bacterium]
MNYIYVSNNVFDFVKEIIDIKSPSVLLLENSPSENIPSTPFKVVPFSKVDDLIRNHVIMILNPERLYPFSPLFEPKYLKVLEVLKRIKPQNVFILSSLLPYSDSKDLLKLVGAKIDNFSFYFDLNLNIEVLFSEDKKNKLLKLVDDRIKTLIVCKNQKQLEEVYNFLSLEFPNILAWNKKEYEYKRRTINLYRSGKFNLVVTKNFLKLRKNIDVENVIYVSTPYSIQHFVRDIINLPTNQLNVFLLISEKDEFIFLRKIRKNTNVNKEYLNFLNFCGFRGDKLEYLRNYFFSINNNHLREEKLLSEGKQRDLVYSLRDKYFSTKEVIELLLGLDEKYYFYRGFGSMRGENFYLLKEEINELVSKGKLGFKYFYEEDGLVKKIY